MPHKYAGQPVPTTLTPLKGLETMRGEIPLATGGSAALSALRKLYQPTQTLGARIAEFAPVGGEALYNTGRGALAQAPRLGQYPSAAADAVSRYLSRIR